MVAPECSNCGSTSITLIPEEVSPGLEAPDEVTNVVENEWIFDSIQYRTIVSGGISRIEFKNTEGSWEKLPANQGFIEVSPEEPVRYCAPSISLPTDAAKRKGLPIFSGVLKYFPDALAAVAEVSRIGNEQHNPGEPLHWAREKSGDELDALARHLIEAGTLDTDGVRHSAKIAWRALANLQKEIEAERLDPTAEG